MDIIYQENIKGKKYSTSNADRSSDINSFDDCSRVLDKNTIVVDLDGWHNDELLNLIFDTFECRTYYTKTQNGYHLYYQKQPRQRVKTKEGIGVLGFKVEHKTSTNSPNGVCEKRNGVANEIIDNPMTLFPDIFKIIPNATLDLMHMGEGNRDNSLFVHSRGIINLGFSKEFVLDVLTFINIYIFDEPLDDVLKFVDNEKRVEKTKENVNDKAKNFMQKYSTVIFDNMLYCRLQDSYTASPNKIKRQIYFEYEDISSSNVDEIFRQCELGSEIIDAHKFPINLVGGHVLDGKYYPYSYTGFTPFEIKYSYDDEVPVSETVEILLDHLTSGDPDYRKLLLQILAYPLIYDFNFKRHHRLISFIVGGGKNGKGTLIQLLTRLYGEDNISTCTVDDLKDKDMLNTCKNKLLNIGDDIEDSAINARTMKILKSISTVDTISTRELYSSGKSSRIACSLLFTSNHVLKSFEKGESWTSRVKWLPAYKKVENPDQEFLPKLLSNESVMYFLKLLIEVLPELYEYGFIDSEMVQTFNSHYHKVNNNTLMFIEEMEARFPDEPNAWLIGVKPKSIYDDYELFCDEIGEKALSSKVLRETLESIYGVTVSEIRNAGKRYRQYILRE